MNGRTSQRRLGISVIEVLFAMGVVVIGLLGIASLLPLASKNASDSMQMSEAQALSLDWYNEFSTRGLDNSSSWVLYRDFATPGKQAFDKQLGSTLSSRGCSPASSTTLRELGRESVCLDPYFFAHRSVETPTGWNSNVPRSQSNWYRPAVFPYYQDTYNPLVDSALTTNVASGLAWDAQPRMLRASFLDEIGNLITVKSLERAFMSTDDVAVTLDKDTTVSALRTGQSNARFAARNQYSWLATISPAEPIGTLSTDSTNLYTLSLVVVRNRDLTIFDPAITAPRIGDAQPEDKPQGERVMWVQPTSGNFNGGSGGRVRLIASDGTKDEISAGDWVMLSRIYAGTATGGGIRPFTIFRWYRVLSVEQKQEGSTLISSPLPHQVGKLAEVTEPATTDDPFIKNFPSTVWGRDVVLEGPDWNFTSPAPGMVSGGSVIPTPTTATIVKGTKAVIERVITVH